MKNLISWGEMVINVNVRKNNIWISGLKEGAGGLYLQLNLKDILVSYADSDQEFSAESEIAFWVGFIKKNMNKLSDSLLKFSNWESKLKV